MNLKYLKYFNLLTLIALFSFIKSGVDFTAIIPPQAVIEELVKIQNYINLNLPSGVKFESTIRENLHLSLKEIADLSNKEQYEVNKVKKSLTDISQNISPTNLKKTLKNARLDFNSAGNLIVLRLPKNSWLTNLAKTIESALEKLKEKGKIKELSKRMDFPNRGHITLGEITNLSELDKETIENLKKVPSSFVNKYDTSFIVDSFIVDSFWLLKSNRPETPRVYFRKEHFLLK